MILSNNKLVEWPGAVLGSIPNLQELHAAYNAFREVKDAFSYAVHFLEGMAHLCCVDVSFLVCAITLFLCRSYSSVRRCHCSNRTYLVLSLDQFPQGAFVAVAKLNVLDLSGTPSRLPPPPALAEMPNLRELRLRYVNSLMIVWFFI